MRVIFTLVLSVITGSAFAQIAFTSQPAGGAWNVGTTWDQTTCASGCVAGVDYPGAIDFAIVAVSAGNRVTFPRTFFSVKDLYVIGDVAGSIGAAGFAGVATVTINGQISGVDPTGSFLEEPSVDVFHSSASGINFVFTGSNLDDPNGAVITLWGHNSPLYRTTFNPGAGNTVRTNSHSIRNSSTVQSGTFLLNSGQEIRGIGGTTSITGDAGTTLNLQGPINGGSTSSGIPTFTSNGTLTAGPSAYINAVSFTLGSGVQFNCGITGQDEGWWHDDYIAPTTPVISSANVNYNASGDQGVASTTYANVSFDGSGTKTIQGAGDFVVDGNLSVIASGVTLTSTNTNEKAVAGNILVNGSWTTSYPMVLNGSATQTISGSGTIAFEGGLEITNTSGSVTLAKDISVSSGLTVGGASTLNLASRILTLNGGTLTYDGTISANTGGSGGTLVSTGTTGVTGTATTKTLNNLTISAGTFTAANAGMGLTGNLNITGGTFIAPTGTLDLAGNLSTVDNTNYDANSGTLNFETTADQTISGTVTVDDAMVDNNGSTNGVVVAGTLNLGGVLTLAPSARFDADGLTGTGSTVLLSSGDAPTIDGSIAILPTTASLMGNVTAHRYMSLEGPGGSDNRIWRYISSPVSGASVSEIQDDIPVTGDFTGSSTCAGCLTNPSMFRYVETEIGDTDDSGGNTLDDGFVQFPTNANTEALGKGQGYALFVRGDLLSSATWSVTGPIHRDATNYSPAYTSTGVAANDGWNLVGNPYPSTIDWDATTGWTRTNLGNAIYITDEAIEQVASYVGGVGTNGGSRYIARGQGFWVQATAGSPQMQSNEPVKVAGTQTTFIREETPVNFLRIALANDKNLKDENVISFRESTTEEFDAHADARKWKNGGVFNLSMVTPEGVELAINSIPDISCGKNIRLKVADVTPGEYALEFSGFDSFADGVLVKLTDKFANKYRVLSAEDAYAFSVTDDASSYGTDRFELTFLNTVPIPELQATAESLGESCGMGSVELVASGAPEDGEYYWYASESDDNPIEEQHGTSFVTPELEKTQTFYVSAVDSRGCLGPKVPVQAEVIQFDPITINEEVSGILESNYTEGIQWYLNDQPIDGATEPVLFADESGKYRVESIIQDGCVASAEYDFIITDLHEQQISSRFKVYPNPTNGVLKFSASEVEQVREVSLMNNIGAVVATMPLRTSGGETFGELDLKGVAAGLYMLKIKGEKTGLVTYKIIMK